MQAELKKRIISAVVLAPPVLGIVWYGGIPFALLMAACFVLMYYEWCSMTKSSSRRTLWSIWGAIYIGLPCYMLVQIDQHNHIILYYIIALVWATDIGAYFAGRAIGGPKLAPRISPKKTWAGLIGGMICAMAAVTLTINLVKTSPSYFLPLGMYALIAVLAVVAQCGDLYESWIKRKFGVKDSGNFIPGHGGLLDRMDGILSVTWVVTLLNSLTVSQ